jgi:predicted RNase H-like nuclease (RuvC/YqgF family)
MGLLSDILKEIPQAAVLKEKIATIEAKYAASDTENSILKDDLREANAEITKLKRQVEELTHKPSELHDLEIQILRLLSLPNYTHDVEGLSAYLGEKPVRIEYHLGRLEHDDYVHGPPPAVMAGMKASYSLTHKGREYLVKNDLLL